MSLVFSGTQYSTTPVNSGGTDFTIMTRVKIPVTNATSTFDVITEYGGRNTFRLFWSNGKFSASVITSTVFIIFVNYATVTATATTASNTGEWLHVAVSYVNKILTLYVNGIVMASASHSNSIVTPSSNTLGAQRTGTSSYTNYFSGELEDFRIYSPSLDSSYIQIIAAHKGVDEIYNNIVGRWELIGSRGTNAPILENVIDSSQNTSPNNTITYG